MDKNILRQEMKIKRAEMPETEKMHADAIIHEKLKQCLGDAKWVLVYVSYGTEVDTRFLIRELLEGTNVHIAVPKVLGDEMEFYEIKSFSDLISGYRGIPEPEKGIPAQYFDALMVMPGLAFDRKRNRIGYGGGYYDRYIGTHFALIEKKVALAYDFQVLTDEIQANPHDIKPDCILTEKDVYF